MDYDEGAKQEFLKICRLGYAGNTSGLRDIDEFDRDYDLHSPAWWYTRDIFVYRILNRALRDQNNEIICTMGFFVRDLHKQIEQLHSASLHEKLTIYRGQGYVRCTKNCFLLMSPVTHFSCKE